MTMSELPIYRGTTYRSGARVDRVLVASTRHMANLQENLEPWHWGEYKDQGTTWIYAYDEDPLNDQPMPEWLLKLCITARRDHDCNRVMLDPDGDVIPGLPVYDH